MFRMGPVIVDEIFVDNSKYCENVDDTFAATVALSPCDDNSSAPYGPAPRQPPSAPCYNNLIQCPATRLLIDTTSLNNSNH